MRVFTILGVVFLVVGVALLFVPLVPGSGSFWDEFRDQGAWIVAITLIPMGIVFTAIGTWLGRLTAGRKRLLREGVPGQATILSIEGGHVVINNIHHLVAFRLLVSAPGRQPYEVRHRQLVPIYAIASMPIGSTVPVMVDPADPQRLTIDLSGEAAAIRQATTVTGVAQVPAAQVVPNTLSAMRSASPNTFTPDLPPPTPPMPAPGWQAPAIAVGQPQSGQAAQALLLATGVPGHAFVRAAADTGIVVQGDSVVELTLDVTAQGGAPYEVRTAALVPAAARSRALPGATVPVRIDPAQRGNVVVDWLR